MKRKLLALLLCLTFLLCSCNQNNVPLPNLSASATPLSGTADSPQPGAGASAMSLSDMSGSPPLAPEGATWYSGDYLQNPRIYTVGNDGHVFTNGYDERNSPETFWLNEHMPDGELIARYDVEDPIRQLHGHEGLIYGIMADQRTEHKSYVFVLDPTTGEMTTTEIIGLPNCPDGWDMTIEDLVYWNGALYALYQRTMTLDMQSETDQNINVYFEPNGYPYYDRYCLLISINPENGEVTDTGIEHMKALYASEDGSLYAMAFDTDRVVTALYAYSGIGLELIRETESLVRMDYVDMFVEDGVLFYAGMRVAAEQEKILYTCDLTTGETLSFAFPNFASNGVAFYHGSILYIEQILNGQQLIITIEGVDYAFDDYDFTLRSLYLRDGLLYDQHGACINSKQIVSISASSSIEPDIATLRHVTGTNGVITALSDVSTEATLAKLMARDSSIDILFWPMGGLNEYAEKLRDLGAYTPLDGLEGIGPYLDNCFDGISDAALHQDEIWMLPLTVSADAIWYVPENLARYGLTADAFTTFDGYWDALERVQNDKGAAFGYSSVVYGQMLSQYNLYEGDWADKRVDYGTDVFKSLFTRMWDGWSYESGEVHPLFMNLSDDTQQANMSLKNLPKYDTSRVAFKYEDIARHLHETERALEGWRVLPAPKLTPNVGARPGTLIVAIINPFNKNMELAEQYLEAIIANPFKTIKSDVLLFKDHSLYEGIYDTSRPMFIDILGVIEQTDFTTSMTVEHNNYVYDYQNGRITADEAIAELQRQVVMWLRE